MLFLLTKMLFLSFGDWWNPTHPSLPSSYGTFSRKFFPPRQFPTSDIWRLSWQWVLTVKITTMTICLINNHTFGKERRLGWSQELHHSSTLMTGHVKCPGFWSGKDAGMRKPKMTRGWKTGFWHRQKLWRPVVRWGQRQREVGIMPWCKEETLKPQEAARVTGTKEWWETHDSGDPEARGTALGRLICTNVFVSSTPPLLHFS